MTNVLLIIILTVSGIAIGLLSYIIYSLDVNISTIGFVLFDKLKDNANAIDYAYNQGYEDGENSALDDCESISHDTYMSGWNDCRESGRHYIIQAYNEASRHGDCELICEYLSNYLDNEYIDL